MTATTPSTDQPPTFPRLRSECLAPLMSSPLARTLLVVAFLAVVVAIVLRVEMSHGPGKHLRLLQRDLGGLGLGAAVVPAWSFRSIDPRLEPCCELDDWPIPGGFCYAPDHTGSVSHFPAAPVHQDDPMFRSRGTRLGPSIKGETSKGETSP